uniref:uncharacterized protein n=1 Tax=Myxine glutinosa TaxID=7769 RepID=UPI00358F8A69
MEMAEGQEVPQTFTKWLNLWGMNPDIATSVVTDLGIPDFPALYACTKSPDVRADLFKEARKKLPFGFYASLRHLVEICFPQDAEKNSVGNNCLQPEKSILIPLLDLLARLLAGLGQDLMSCGQQVVKLQVGEPCISTEFHHLFDGSAEDVPGLDSTLNQESSRWSEEGEEELEESEEPKKRKLDESRHAGHLEELDKETMEQNDLQMYSCSQDSVNGWQPIHEDVIGQTEHEIKVEMESIAGPALTNPVDVASKSHLPPLTTEVPIIAKDRQFSSHDESPTELSDITSVFAPKNLLLVCLYH